MIRVLVLLPLALLAVSSTTTTKQETGKETPEDRGGKRGKSLGASI